MEFFKGHAGWGCGSVLQHLASMYESLGSAPRAAGKRHRYRWQCLSEGGREGIGSEGQGSNDMACFVWDRVCSEQDGQSRGRNVDLTLVG